MESVGVPFRSADVLGTKRKRGTKGKEKKLRRSAIAMQRSAIAMQRSAIAMQRSAKEKRLNEKEKN